MSSIRSLIDGFVWNHLEKFVSLVDEGGEDTVFEGIRVLDEPEKFVHGALVNATANLYVHYVNTNDVRSEATLQRLLKFLSFVLKTDVKTWGKLSCLRGIFTLYKAGQLDKLPSSVIEVLKEKTDYTDFYDKERNEIINLPTNYYRVAMACAGYRERLGWDTERFSATICEKLVGIVEAGSEIGWMDEDPPHGRFDRYSIILSSEFADTAMELELEMPEFLKSNLKSAAELSLFMANKNGDGVNYGRSLSCHGDATPLEIIASASAMGLLDKENYGLAVAYSVKIIEKILGFWYDKEKGSFDIWWRGRTTNKYRQVHRVLEVNLDMAMHLITTLANFERAELDKVDADNSLIRSVNKWTVMRTDFTPRRDRALFALKYKDTLSLLPIIGLGGVCDWAAYMPFPSICGAIEGAPQAHIPFLIPEYKLSCGALARPIEFYNTVECDTVDDTVRIVAGGNLAIIDNGTPVKSEYTFSTVYTFSNGSISVKFNTDAPFFSAEMVTGVRGNASLAAVGFDSSEHIDTADKDDYKTPSGRIDGAFMNVKHGSGEFGYIIKF